MKQRIVIQFLVKSGVKPTEILQKLKAVYGDDCMSKTRVFEWARRFREGRESVEDDPREGAPVSSRTEPNVERLRALVTADRRLTLRALSEELHINKETIRRMLHEDLNMRKICAKMVPKILTADQKQLRMEICNDLLSRIESNGRDWLQNVVTGDESWIFEYDPETRRQSMQWMEVGGERPTKARMSKSKLKAMLLIFFDIQGVVHREYLPEGQTVTGQFYVGVLERLRARIVRVRPELAKNGWILHHDNAPAHSSLIIREFLAKKNIPTMPHPPYSPDLAPCDFFLFPKMKSYLKGTHHGGVEEVKEAVTAVLNSLTPEDFQGCFEGWERRWKRCVELQGDYCEGR